MSKLTRMINLALCLGLLSASMPAGAQSVKNKNAGRKEVMKQKAEDLKVQLNLSAEQAVKYDEILKRNKEEAKTKMMVLPQDAERKERMEIMKKSMENADMEILEILDSEQQKIYKTEKDKLKAEVKENRKKRT